MTTQKSVRTISSIKLKTNEYYAIFKPLRYVIFSLIFFALGIIANQYLPNMYLIHIGGAIATFMLLSYLYSYLYLKSISYTISPSQILYEKGVFTRSKDNLELYRVKDYEEKRTFLMRLIKAMTLKLETSDKSHPTFEFIGINKSNIGDQLRILVEKQRKIKGVREFD